MNLRKCALPLLLVWIIIFPLASLLMPVRANPDPSIISTSEDATAINLNSQRKLVRASDGTLYVTYFKLVSGAQQIFVAKSIDNGTTWTDETKISTYPGMSSAWQQTPAIAIDSNDNLYVVWQGGATGYSNIQIWYAKYNGSAWSVPERISTYSGMESYAQYYPSIIIDTNNNLHVVWYGNATGYTTRQIWYANYNGSAWSVPERISTYSGMELYNQTLPAIAIDFNNFVHVVWCGKATGYTAADQIWYAVYNGSWQTPVRISTSSGMESYAQANPSITVDLNNYIHAVWKGRATGYSVSQIWYATYNGSWQIPVRISTSSGMESYAQKDPSIAVDITNFVHVVWFGQATGYIDYDKIWYANYTTSWSTPICLQATGQNTYPNLRGSLYPESNRIYHYLDYVFTEGTASPYNIKFDRVFINHAPNAPTLSSPSAWWRFDPEAIASFQWQFSDPDMEDVQVAYQLQIGNSDFSIIYMDTGKVNSANEYANIALPSNMTVGAYYWRLKTWDDYDAESTWSNTKALVIDKIKVESIATDKFLRNLGSVASINVTLRYAWDSNAIESGNFALNGIPMSYVNGGVWQALDVQGYVHNQTYNNVNGVEGVYGLTAVDMNGKSLTIEWGRNIIYNNTATEFSQLIGFDVFNGVIGLFQFILGDLFFAVTLLGIMFLSAIRFQNLSIPALLGVICYAVFFNFMGNTSRLVVGISLALFAAYAIYQAYTHED